MVCNAVQDLIDPDTAYKQDEDSDQEINIPPNSIINIYQKGK